ncbi:MAG: hypothetical protein ACK5HY_16505 [Parahaliea sp.]
MGHAIAWLVRETRSDDRSRDGYCYQPFSGVEPSPDINIDDFLYVVVNETAKAIKEGVCSAVDVGIAARYSTGGPGPFESLAGKDLQGVLART